MIVLNAGQPVVLDRHEGYLHLLEATHHYCSVGKAADGTILASFGMHPDIRMPENVYVPVDVEGSDYPLYKFRPREAYPNHRWPHDAATCRSEDGGHTWSDPVVGVGCFGVVSVGDKTLCPGGRLWLLEPGLAVTFFSESDDSGLSWSDRPGVLFHFPPELDLVVSETFYPGVKVVMNFENCGTFKVVSDGSIVTFGTAAMERDGRQWKFPLMFRSTDGGFHFEFVGFPTGTEPPLDHGGFVEPALTELPSGDLLAAFRTSYHRPDRVMMQCRSSDGGRTWRGPVVSPGVPRHYPLRGLQPIRNQGKMYSNAANVSPGLASLPNGVIVMVYGRPGVHITFSEDGSGNEWTDRIPVVPERSLFGINYESSDMAGVIDVGENELLMVYDVYNYQPPEGGPQGNTVFALHMTAEKD